MDTHKIGALIVHLRKEMGLTQKQLAEQLNVSDRTISKWERGNGCPDISLLPSLASTLGTQIENLLDGEISSEEIVGGNMKKSLYFVCQSCQNIGFATGNATFTCCGKKMEPLEEKKAEVHEKLLIEEIDQEWFISADHPMTKDHFISFITFATGDSVQILKQYPEWNLQTRIPKQKHGKLVWYDTKKGLFYQLI